VPRSTVPASLVVFEVDETDAVWPLYRIVKSGDATDEEFDRSFRSSYELGNPPRHVENRLAVVHMGLSMYETINRAQRTARAWPKIGGWIARVDLVPGQGFCGARTGQPGHWTIWGRPDQLIRAVADIVRVEG
jgi:hypothetical protein